MPIWPCDPHPDTHQLLVLRGGVELRKRSYVKIDRVYEVGWGWLGLYDEGGDDFIIEDEGMQMLDDVMKGLGE